MCTHCICTLYVDLHLSDFEVQFLYADVQHEYISDYFSTYAMREFKVKVRYIFNTRIILMLNEICSCLSENCNFLPNFFLTNNPTEDRLLTFTFVLSNEAA